MHYLFELYSCVWSHQILTFQNTNDSKNDQLPCLAQGVLQMLKILHMFDTKCNVIASYVFTKKSYAKFHSFVFVRPWVLRLYFFFSLLSETTLIRIFSHNFCWTKQNMDLWSQFYHLFKSNRTLHSAYSIQYFSQLTKNYIAIRLVWECIICRRLWKLYHMKDITLITPQSKLRW